MKNNRNEIFGWYFYDFAASGFSTTVITVLLSPYLTSIAQNAANSQGYLSILGISIYADSLFSYVVAISVIFQVFILPLLGSIADYTHRKKQIFLFFAYLGSFAAMGLFFLQGTNYVLGSILLIVSNLSFGASIVMYNAFLNDITTEDKRDSVSSRGWAFGFLGGGILLAMNLALINSAESIGITTAYAVRISMASAGMWWAIFTIIPAIRIKNRENSKRMPDNESILYFGYKELFNTLRQAKKYPTTFRFLIAFLIYNDGVQAVIVVASQYAIIGLGLEQSVVIQVILMVQFVAFIGTLLFNIISQKSNTKTALLISLAIWSIAVIGAYTFVRTELEFYILGAVIALVLGGTQALSRSLFSLFIPEGKEAEYFSLYEISERGTSWLGPLIFGLSLQFTGSYQFAILSLLIFFVAGAILLAFVNVKKGINEAGNKIPKNFRV